MPSRPRAPFGRSAPRRAAARRSGLEVPGCFAGWEPEFPTCLLSTTDPTQSLAMPGDNSSLTRAAAWMSGWLAAMLVMVVAGREAARTLHVFQIMEMRSLIGLLLLYPLVRATGGVRAMRTDRPRLHLARNA